MQRLLDEAVNRAGADAGAEPCKIGKVTGDGVAGNLLGGIRWWWPVRGRVAVGGLLPRPDDGLAELVEDEFLARRIGEAGRELRGHGIEGTRLDTVPFSWGDGVSALVDEDRWRRLEIEPALKALDERRLTLLKASSAAGVGGSDGALVLVETLIEDAIGRLWGGGLGGAVALKELVKHTVLEAVVVRDAPPLPAPAAAVPDGVPAVLGRGHRAIAIPPIKAAVLAVGPAASGVLIAMIGRLVGVVTRVRVRRVFARQRLER